MRNVRTEKKSWKRKRTTTNTEQEISGKVTPRIGESEGQNIGFDYLVPIRTLPFAFLTVTTTIPMNND
ncbi:hypothetical protein BHG07_10065 [Brenneria salicis ATCC 15712 = DSM 30166]|nr:hypothetical protein BHG07_10065 [Brenneria salicis ATCC 15712 = DSM 30166]